MIGCSSKFYNHFKQAVKKRTVDKMVVPVSGGLDSTLIVKALRDNGDLIKSFGIYLHDGDRSYFEQVCDKYRLKNITVVPVHYYDDDTINMVKIWEEPYYAPSINYYLFEEIKRLGYRVCMSGVGADELFGGYTYYNTPDYPRGFFEPIKAVSNSDKRKQDLHLLTYHHLRKMDKMGMYFNVETRYPFLDREIIKYEDVGKSMIKEILSEDFDDDFINRPKQGFRAGVSSKEMYLKQISIWIKLFT